MDSQVTCEVVRDRLEAFAEGALSDEEFLQLMNHIDTCRDCAVLLRMQQHTSAISTQELESEVPDRFVDGMYRGVLEKIEERAPGRSWLSRLWPRQELLVPAFAAAIVILLFGGGMMLQELRHLQQREHVLTSRIERQERLIGVPAAAVGGDGLKLPGQNWRRVLSRHEDMSVEDLQMVLRRLPPGTSILTPKETATLFERYDRWAGNAWKNATESIETHDGLQVEEMLRLIESLDPNPDRRIPTARLITLSHHVGARDGSLVDRRVW